MNKRIEIEKHVDGRRRVKEAYMVSIVCDHVGEFGVEDLVISQEWAADLDEVAYWSKCFSQFLYS